MLLLLYSLSQNADFAKRIKPLLENLKNSEEMLSIFKEASQFMQSFNDFSSTQKKQDAPPKTSTENDEKKTSASPTSGIADEFIQTILDNYLKNK